MELGNSHLPPSSFQGPPGSHFNPSDIDLGDFVPFAGGSSASEFPSPAHQVYNFDMSSSVNSSHMSTVSPNDLLMSNDLMSAPGSAALTALTTPSGYDGSPAFTDAWDGSPLFAANDASADAWPSLFPDAQVDHASVPAAQADESPVAMSEEIEPARKASKPRKSSASSSPSGRHSSVAGVNARRRRGDLPPITVSDPSDTVSMKRAKNTLAARKSRARKAERMEDLERIVRELEASNEKLAAERDQWKAIATRQNGSGAQ